MKIWLPTAGDGCVADLWRCTEHSFIDLYIVGLTGSQAGCCEGSGPTNKAKRKELLNINPVICFQGAGSWRGQWAEGLHVDLRHRLPPGGSLLWLFSLPVLMGRWGGRGARRLTADRIESNTERLQNVTSGGLWFDLVTVVVRVSNTEVSTLCGEHSGCSHNDNGESS